MRRSGNKGIAVLRAVREPTPAEIDEHAAHGEVWEPVSRQWVRAADVATEHDRLLRRR